jgi:hypothetical protein
VTAVRTATRDRRYVSPRTLTMLSPFLRYSWSREAYILRLVGARLGPVLRPDRRSGHIDYEGPERRAQ